MDKIGETTLFIDLAALEHNFTFFTSRLAPGTKFMGVVKAFAYGNDSVAIAQKLETLGVDYLAVAYTKEGVLLRKTGITVPILILHPQPMHFGTLIDEGLEPNLYSLKTLKGFLDEVQKKERKAYPVHLKFNTGLNRLGFKEGDIEEIGRLLQSAPQIQVKGILSHLAASEDITERAFSIRQIQTFTRITEAMTQFLGNTPIRHLLNTSGILNYPESQFDMVRSGIGLYGYANDPEIDRLLKPVATLKTLISQVHILNSGESVGYNRAFIAGAHRRIATLPLGHADGIGRHYGGGDTHVLVKGELAPIVGNVCMDMIMIDVTDIPCEAGDEVLIFGPERSAETMAQSGKTISYELLTAISTRVARRIVH